MILINRKLVCGLLCISVLLNAIFAVLFFHYSFSIDDKSRTVTDSNVLTFENVSAEMTNPKFWKSHYNDGDKIIMTLKEILELNYQILHTEECAMNDLVEFNETFDSQAVLSEISENRIPVKDIYINGEKIEKAEFFGFMQEQISRIDTTDNETKYAVAVRRCDIRLWPTDKIVGYSPDDYDDELQNSSININEPLILTLSVNVNNQTYYWAYTTSSSGWVNANQAAICSSKVEWLDAWKVDIDSKNFIVVTENKINTCISPNSEISEITLPLGTVLKLCPSSEIPEELYGQKPLHCHTVYLPVRKGDGTYDKSIALIPQHYSVSVGYLPMTKANIIDTAFSCLGERYGWGGMNNSMDCSYFIKSVYSCFGLDLPRNTDNQAMIPNKSKSISDMNQENKLQYIRSLPPCSLLIMPNHVAMYLGTIDGESYFINAQGCNFDRNKGMSTNINTINIIPLSTAITKRGTWLEVFTDSVMFED